MFGKGMKLLGLGLLIGGTAAALYAMNKKQKEEPTEPDIVIDEAQASEYVSEEPVKKADPFAAVKDALKSRPSKLTGKDWFDKGYALLSDDADAAHLLKARECFENASKKGYVEATRTLAEMYAQGYGVDQDREKSFGLYLLAAEDGDEESWTQLATCYAEGVGTEIDPIEAFYWYAMATAAGDETAKEILGAYGEDIPQQDEFPVELVRDWYESRYPDLTAEQQLEVEEFWDECADEMLYVDTDLFLEDEDTVLIIEDENVVIDPENCEDSEECCGRCCECGETEDCEIKVESEADATTCCPIEE